MKTFLKKLLRTSGFLALSLVAQQSYGQDQITVSGIVTAQEDGGPLAGVSIVVKNTVTGVTTDFDGNYTIEAPSDGILVFTYIGFKKLEVPINGDTAKNITMAEDVANLDEVIITGYSTQEKKSITGAISSVTSEDLENVHAGSTISSALAGKMAG